MSSCAGRLKKQTLLVIGLVTLLMSSVANLQHAQAAPAFVRSAGTVTNNTTTASVSLAANPTLGNLLVLVCSTPGASTFSATGYTLAKSVSGAPSQAILYKFVTNPTTDRTATCSITRQRGLAQLLEYSGISSTNTLDAVNGSPSSGASTTPQSGSVTAVYPHTLVVAAMSYATGTGLNTWTNGFTERRDNANNATINAGVGDYTSYRARTLSTSATKNTTTAWRGQIVAFRAVLPPSQLSVDAIDASGASVASPSAAFGSSVYNFDCQTTTATLGTPTQTIRVMNTTTTAVWTLSIAANGLPTSTWSGGTQKYDYNDPTSAGCADGTDTDTVGGQMTVSAASSTVDSVCSTTGISKGALTGFVEGTTNSIQLLKATASAPTGCIWDLTNVALTQTIPPGQEPNTYSLGLMMTITAI